MTITDDLIAAAQVRPYYARALAALTPVARPGLGTVAVDYSWRLYYDPSWLASHSPRHRAHLIAAHEIEHLLRDHGSRLPRDMRGNVAADIEINDDVPESDLPSGGVRPSDLGLPDGLLAEEYLARMDAHDDAECSCGGGSGSGGAPLPEELPPDDGGIDQDTADRIRDDTALAVREYTKANGRGSVPAGVLVWADARAQKSRPDWRRVLAAYLGRIATGRGSDDYSWSRRPRRDSGAVLRPGRVRLAPEIAIVVDTSGSMAGLGGWAIGHVEAIARRCGRTTVVCCDTAAHLAKSGRYVGGGGTDLRVALAHRVVRRADVVIVLTDGGTPWPDNPDTPVVVVTPPAAPDTPTWAKRIEATP